MNQPNYLPELIVAKSDERLKWGMFPRSTAYWIGLFYLATVVIRPWEKLIPELGALRFERVLGIAMVGLVGVSYKWSLRGGVITLAAMGFVAMMFVTSRFAILPELCERDLIALISITISFFVIVFIPRTTYQLYFLLFAYVGIVFVYISKAQWEYFFNGAAMFQMGVRRLPGIEYYYGHPNAVGGSVVCSLPIAYFLYQIRDEFTQTWPRRYRRLFPWFLRLFGLVAISGILLTRSRTAAICLVAFAMLAAFTSTSGILKKIQRFALVGVVMVAGFFFLPQDMQGRIQTLWDSTVERDGAHRGATESGQGRLLGFMLGVEMFQRHPWTGVGLANFKEYREAKMDGQYLDAHNLAGEVLAETGILGTTAFLLLIFVVVWKLLQTRKRALRLIWHPRSRSLLLMSIACLQVLAMLLLQGVASHNLQRYNWFWVAAFAALCATQLRVAEQEESAYWNILALDDSEDEFQGLDATDNEIVAAH